MRYAKTVLSAMRVVCRYANVDMRLSCRRALSAQCAMRDAPSVLTYDAQRFEQCRARV